MLDLSQLRSLRAKVKEAKSQYDTELASRFSALSKGDAYRLAKGKYERALFAASDELLAAAEESVELLSRIAELERLGLEAQHRIADLCAIVGNIEQCRCVEGDSVQILCDNPEADSADTQAVVEACGDYTGYEPQRFYGKTWDEALAKAARVSQRHYITNSSPTPKGQRHE